MAARKRVIQDRGEEELDCQYVQGYLRTPEDPALGEAGLELAEEVWPIEEWPEAEESKGLPDNRP